MGRLEIASWKEIKDENEKVPYVGSARKNSDARELSRHASFSNSIIKVLTVAEEEEPLALLSSPSSRHSSMCAAENAMEDGWSPDELSTEQILWLAGSAELKNTHYIGANTREISFRCFRSSEDYQI